MLKVTAGQGRRLSELEKQDELQEAGRPAEGKETTHVRCFRERG